MKNDKWPMEYTLSPNIKKRIEEIWQDLDAFTYESSFEKEEKHKDIDFVIPLPPLDYKGIKTKGIFFSQGVDVIVEKFPKIKEIFIPIANSLIAGYPDSNYADAYFACYKNKKREKYYKKLHPEKKDIILLPLGTADFINEYKLAPTFNTPKDTDIFCVTTAYPFKNMPMFAAAIKMYELKYAKRLKVKYALGNKDIIKHDDGSIDYSKIRKDAKEQLDKVYEILDNEAHKYIDFYPWIDYKDLPKFYTAARCSVLCALYEGKNRFIYEAMSCNTPVIVFKDFNKYARSKSPIFYENSGEYVNEFNAESLADTIHKVLNNLENYEPRRNYLKYFGRKNFINTVIDSIPYYRKNLPEYKKGAIQDNLWVDLAMQADYQLSFYDFLYGKNTAIQHRRGLNDIESLIKFFFSRFNIKD